MNLKSISILSLSLTLLLSCSSLSSDDTPKIEVPIVKITGVNVKALDFDGNDSFYTDTLNHGVRFSVYTEYETIGSEMVPMFHPLSEGDIVPGIVANPTHPSYASLKFQNIIHYYERPIESGMNLLDDLQIQNSFDGSSSDLLFNDFLSPFAVGSVRFRQPAFQFESGPHEIIFTWGNSEQIFRDTVQVYMDLNQN